MVAPLAGWLAGWLGGWLAGSRLAYHYHLNEVESVAPQDILAPLEREPPRIEAAAAPRYYNPARTLLLLFLLLLLLEKSLLFMIACSVCNFLRRAIRLDPLPTREEISRERDRER